MREWFDIIHKIIMWIAFPVAFLSLWNFIENQRDHSVHDKVEVSCFPSAATDLPGNAPGTFTIIVDIGKREAEWKNSSSPSSPQ